MAWQRVLIVGPAVVILCVAGCYRHNVKTRSKREAGYQESLKHYAETFPLGNNRKTVEDYLRAHGIQFGQGAGPGSLNAWSDYIRIGEEPAPWYCSKWDVYVALDFAEVEKHDAWDERDSDSLKKVRLERRGEGCL